MKCPFKFKEFSDPERQQCDTDCALAVDNTGQSESPSAMCSITLIATALGDLNWLKAFEQDQSLPDSWMRRNDIEL